MPLITDKEEKQINEYLAIRKKAVLSEPSGKEIDSICFLLGMYRQEFVDEPDLRMANIIGFVIDALLLTKHLIGKGE